MDAPPGQLLSSLIHFFLTKKEHALKRTSRLPKKNEEVRLGPYGYRWFRKSPLFL
jgi:hypothetical protein